MIDRPKLVLDRPREVYEFVKSRLQDLDCHGGFQAIGVERRGKLIGGFVFYDMARDRSDVQFAVAGNGAFLSVETINFLYYNAFEVLKVAHVTARSAISNIRAIRADLKAGFKIEGIQRKAWNGKEDAVLLGLTKEDVDDRKRLTPMTGTPSKEIFQKESLHGKRLFGTLG